MGMSLEEYAEKHPESFPEPITAAEAPPRFVRADMVEESQLKAVEICEKYSRREQEAQLYLERIFQGIKEKRHAGTLLLLAAKCIACLTENSGLYDSMAKALDGVYGGEMFDSPVPEIRVKQLEKELSKLKRERSKIDKQVAEKQKELDEFQGQAMEQQQLLW